MRFWNAGLTFALAIILPIRTFAAESQCYKEIESNFFNESLVNQALANHNISQSNWALINQTLKSNNKNIPSIVRQRAKTMSPNPFDTPFRPLEAAKILNQVQLEVFASTLATFGINSPVEVKQMFLYIRQNQSHKLVSCFGKEVMEDSESTAMNQKSAKN